MKVSLFRMSLPALLFGASGCAVSSPQVSTPAADPSSSFTTTAPPRRVLGEDETTRKTNRLLAAAGAKDLDGLKPMNMEAMEGMDHSSLGMEHSNTAEAPKPATKAPMDHSQHSAPAASPAEAQTAPVPDAAHVHTSEPETSSAPKAAPDAPQPKPAAALPAGMDHSNH